MIEIIGPTLPVDLTACNNLGKSRDLRERTEAKSSWAGMEADAGEQGNRIANPSSRTADRSTSMILFGKELSARTLTIEAGGNGANEPEDEKPCASIGFKVRTGEHAGVLRLCYTVTILDAGKIGKAAELKSYPIELVTTRLPTKGLRWWFVCPVQRVDQHDPCRRRVGMLYLPGGENGTLFACRQCYGLTYRSCRESRSYQGMWSSLGASCGMSGKRAKRILDDKWNGEAKAEQRLRQRGVLVDTAKNTDIPSTSMDSVN